MILMKEQHFDLIFHDPDPPLKGEGEPEFSEGH